jgi:hypothetical protein
VVAARGHARSRERRSAGDRPGTPLPAASRTGARTDARRWRRFYALATEDYRQLVLAADWASLLAGVSSPGWRLLDVACGSGKFPTALLDAGSCPPCRPDVRPAGPVGLLRGRGQGLPPTAAGAGSRAGRHPAGAPRSALRGRLGDARPLRGPAGRARPVRLALRRGPGAGRARRRRAGHRALALPRLLRRLPGRRHAGDSLRAPSRSATPCGRPARRSASSGSPTGRAPPTAPSRRASCSAARSTTPSRSSRWRQRRCSATTSPTAVVPTAPTTSPTR